MDSPPPSLPIEEVKQELRRLRQGQGLAHPGAVLQLSPRLRAHLTGGEHVAESSTDEIAHVVASLRRGIGRLNRDQQLYAQVDFNLADEHSHPTLTARQESLAGLLGCAAKTVRRRSDQALEAMAFVLATNSHMSDIDTGLAPASVTAASEQSKDRGSRDWQATLRRFWRLSPHARVDIVCSEIPEDERPSFASPRDRNYLRYSKFADLDTLIYVRGRLTQTLSDIHVRDFAPSEYYGTDANSLIVIGGPPWNAKCREFLPQLPYHFAPHPLGEDDPLVLPQLDNLTIGPRWTERSELLADLAVFTRLTLAEDTTVFLLGGCVTLGVLGAGRCFLQGEHGAANVDYISDLVGESDFVLVTEARRVGGITDVADLDAVPPLLVLDRRRNEPFTVVLDNTKRWTTR